MLPLCSRTREEERSVTVNFEVGGAREEERRRRLSNDPPGRRRGGSHRDLREEEKVPNENYLLPYAASIAMRLIIEREMPMSLSSRSLRTSSSATVARKTW